MSLTIELTPSEVTQLSVAAKEAGLIPSQLLKKLLREYLHAGSTVDKLELDTKLHSWQEQDGMKMMPNISTQTLFAQWAAEDSQMTDEERESEDRLWKELEKRFSEENFGIDLRR